MCTLTQHVEREQAATVVAGAPAPSAAVDPAEADGTTRIRMRVIVVADIGAGEGDGVMPPPRRLSVDDAVEVDELCACACHK